MVCNHVHGIPAVNQMLQRNEKKMRHAVVRTFPPPQLARVHISRIASGASISWECPPCRVPSVARKSPGTTSRLQIALFARVSDQGI